VHSLFVFNQNIYCGVQGYGVTVSSNNGGYWTFHHPLGNRTIYSLTYNGGNLYAGASAMNPGQGVSGVYLSIDNGYSFTPTSLTNKTVNSLGANSGIIFAGIAGEGIYVTTNNGVNWTQTSINNQNVKSLGVNGNFIFAGTIGSGVYISTNNGSSWVQSALNNQDVNSLAVYGNSVFAGTSSESNFFVSTNNGTSWTLRNEGLGNYMVSAICIINNFIFAGTNSNGVYRRSLNELVGINPVTNEIPKEYSLSQNYPNPFNPSTTIRFAIPVGTRHGAFVQIKVYDALGREVDILVNEQLSPGTYEVEWPASDYPSGVYFYKLIAGSYTDTKKMILSK
jgi:hypothetical protein